jgi:hypothetical protein
VWDGKLQSGLQQSCSGGDPPQASSMVDSVYLASDPLNKTGPKLQHSYEPLKYVSSVLSWT